jgi:hypothetical protein
MYVLIYVRLLIANFRVMCAQTAYVSMYLHRRINIDINLKYYSRKHVMYVCMHVYVYIYVRMYICIWT